MKDIIFVNEDEFFPIFKEIFWKGLSKVIRGKRFNFGAGGRIK